MSAPALHVGVAGLGAVGGRVARHLASGAIPGLRLSGASGRSVARTSSQLRALALHDAPALEPEALAEASDLVVEAAPAASFLAIARPVLEAGRTLVPLSVGALLQHRESLPTTGRVMAPSGALTGFDAIRAIIALGAVERARLVTRKPPAALPLPPGFAATAAQRVFAGLALEAVRAFPANANVAAAVVLAGVPAERLMVEVWADPTLNTNVHRLEIISEPVRLSVELDCAPLADHPRTSGLALGSVLALLSTLAAPLRVGS